MDVVVSDLYEQAACVGEELAGEDEAFVDAV